MESDIEKLAEEFGKIVGQTQAMSLANSYILMEVVREMARKESDPAALLSKMFENASARLDQQPVEKEAHPVSLEIRRSLEVFFTKAGRGL
jgi:hypothetical protein